MLMCRNVLLMLLENMQQNIRGIRTSRNNIKRFIVLRFVVCFAPLSSSNSLVNQHVQFIKSTYEKEVKYFTNFLALS